MLKEKTIVLYGSRDALCSELTDRLTANGARLFCLDPTTDPDPGDLLAGIGEPVDGLIFLPVSSPDHPVSELDSATITTATALGVTTPLLIVREAVNRLFRPESPASIIFTVDPAALDAAGRILVRDGLVHEHDDLVLVLHIVDQGVDIDGQKRHAAHDDQAGHDDGHRCK